MFAKECTNIAIYVETDNHVYVLGAIKLLKGI